jgi:hypothetical protein
MNARSRLPLANAPDTQLGRLYWRELPGGGYVALDVVAQPAHAGGGFFGTITVERRSDEARREGSTPPVIAKVCCRTTGAVLHRLLPIARSNPAVASALLRRRA